MVSLIGMFLSPLPTFWRIWKKKSVEEFSPLPYLSMLMNCSLWICYGIPIVHPIEQHFGSHRQWHRIHHRVHVRGWVFYVLRWEESERCVTDLVERVYLHRHHALFGAFSHSFSSSSVSHHRSSLCHRWNFAIHFFSFHHGIGIYINNIIYICIRIETLIKP